MKINCNKILLERIKTFHRKKIMGNAAAQPYVPSTIWDTHNNIWKKHKLWGTWHGSFDCRKLQECCNLQLNSENCCLLFHSNGFEMAGSERNLQGCQTRCCRSEKQSWSPQGFQAECCRGRRAPRFAFPRFITVIPQCAGTSLLFPVSSFPTGCNSTKRSMGNTVA